MGASRTERYQADDQHCLLACYTVHYSTIHVWVLIHVLLRSENWLSLRQARPRPRRVQHYVPRTHTYPTFHDPRCASAIYVCDQLVHSAERPMLLPLPRLQQLRIESDNERRLCLLIIDEHLHQRPRKAGGRARVSSATCNKNIGKQVRNLQERSRWQDMSTTCQQG